MRNDFDARKFKEKLGVKNMAIGIMLGYPECCIRSHFGALDHRNVTKILWGTGYVPCSKCARASKKHLISVINTNRLIPQQFGERLDFKTFTNDYVYSRLGISGQCKLKLIKKNIRVRSRMILEVI